MLLARLMREGVMQHRCIAFHDPALIQRMEPIMKDRTVMHMGTTTKPGPFWLVHSTDVPALEAKGYRVVPK